jgi:hypothetical protein
MRHWCMRHWGDRLVGHISRDGTAIEAREKLAKKVDVLEAQPT